MIRLVVSDYRRAMHVFEEHGTLVVEDDVLMIEGKKVQTVGLPLHWGFKGLAKPGYLVNTLTPSVGDGNSQTPEFKSFLVKVEKA